MTQSGAHVVILYCSISPSLGLTLQKQNYDNLAMTQAVSRVLLIALRLHRATAPTRLIASFTKLHPEPEPQPNRTKTALEWQTKQYQTMPWSANQFNGNRPHLHRDLPTSKGPQSPSIPRSGDRVSKT